MVNLTATEAKVEVLTSEVVQLRPEAAQGRGGEDDAQDDYFMYDDDDNYQYEVTALQPSQDHMLLLEEACESRIFRYFPKFVVFSILQFTIPARSEILRPADLRAMLRRNRDASLCILCC